MKLTSLILFAGLVLFGAACTKSASRDESLAAGVVHLVKQRVPALEPQVPWGTAGGGGGGTRDGVGEYAWAYAFETVSSKPVPEAETADLLGKVRSEVAAWLEQEDAVVHARGETTSGDQLHRFTLKYHSADELGWVIAWGHHAGGEYTLFLSVTARRN